MIKKKTILLALWIDIKKTRKNILSVKLIKYIQENTEDWDVKTKKTQWNFFCKRQLIFSYIKTLLSNKSILL